MKKKIKIFLNTTRTCKKYHGDSVEFGKSGEFMVLGILHVKDIPKLMYIQGGQTLLSFRLFII